MAAVPGTSSSSSSSLRDSASVPLPTFAQVLDDVILCEQFRRYLVSQYCDESLEFLLAVREFKQLEDEEHRKAKAISIWETFVKAGSPHEISFDAPDKRAIDAAIADDNITLSIFDVAQAFTESLLRNDSFNRFLTTELQGSTDSARRSVRLRLPTRQPAPPSATTTTTAPAVSPAPPSATATAAAIAAAKPAVPSQQRSYGPVLLLAAPFVVIVALKIVTWLLSS